jgi:EF-P beta-lysylation protein EpmB
MIASDYTTLKTNNKTISWQQQLTNSKIDPKKLLEHLNLDIKLLPEIITASTSFTLRVPLAFISRIKKNDVNDPLLKQVLPTTEELAINEGFSFDPLSEKDYTPTSGLIHKYQGRVLLVTTSACAVNCRYCFRRYFPYSDHRSANNQRENILDYLRSTSSIKEVILSGGDPLIASDNYLEGLIKDLETINNITTLRIHTRLPIMIPDRITSKLLAVLTNSRFKIVIVIHCNHAQEIDVHVQQALSLLKNAGVTLLNQAVLLRGVNNSSEALYKLSEKLFFNGVLPYYLHLLDLVHGTKHFEVKEQQAISIVKQLANTAPGYLVPKLVKEVPGEKSKTRVL